MPTPRLDSSIQEWDFTPEEERSAKILSPLQLVFLHTKYAQFTKEKAARLIPENAADDRDFWNAIAELDGKMGFIKEMLDDHQAAIKDQTAKTADSLQGLDEAEVARRAAALVNQPVQS